ncbi:aminoglycoside phosphotransferase (APT) family kinase protein [Geodermatophilus bullaregiensis]|uniref:phosphotransferase family protein n=1 Tax=Geodermatophilus bullaregiensis TaxID=1564160 RepID=UPI00195787E2|nr:phosphotransferase family protein [Geodermatophilus bullaregiensis]MBM7806405.1 aminoglycoside phosphotransferase (APT) family kinase protein [Geodermatophilus bullaregiensis]
MTGSPAASGTSPEELAPALARRLSRLTGGRVTVEGLTRLTGGANRETWAFTAVDDTARARRDLVLRGGAGTGGVPLPVEAAAVAAAARAGVPAPDLVDVGAGDAGEGLPAQYLLMGRVDGETIPRRLLREETYATARAGLAHELGAVLARLHAVPLDDLAQVPAPGDPLDRLTSSFLTGGPPPPGLALGLRWLRGHRPPARPTVLVHGDFRLGNLMVGPEGLRAVLDWELVHRGDPLEDLGWCCAKVWRFGSRLPAAGTGTREELLDGYAAVAGWRPTVAELHWWELYGTVQWGLMCRAMTERHLSGAEPSVELAAIGRRAAEQEFDVLLALGLDRPDAAPPDDATPDDATPDEAAPDDDLLFGRPTAAELAAAVGDFLAGEVRAGTGGRTSFHAQVAANVVATVRRELLLGDGARARRRARLRGLDLADDAALSEAVADGSRDGRWDEVVAAVREGVRDRLRVANPRHLAVPDADDEGVTVRDLPERPL